MRFIRHSRATLVKKVKSVDISKLGFNFVTTYFKPRDLTELPGVVKIRLRQYELFRKWGVLGSQVILWLDSGRVKIDVNSALGPDSVQVSYLPHIIEDDSDPEAFGHVFQTTVGALAFLREAILESSGKKARFLDLDGEYGHSFEWVKDHIAMLEWKRIELLEKTYDRAGRTNPCGEIPL
jgi:hypothetical protein